MTDHLRITVRHGDPGKADTVDVVLNDRDISETVYDIAMVYRDALEEGAPCDRAFVNNIPYPVNIRRGPKWRETHPNPRSLLGPGDIIVIAETPSLEHAQNGAAPR